MFFNFEKFKGGNLFELFFQVGIFCIEKFEFCLCGYFMVENSFVGYLEVCKMDYDYLDLEGSLMDVCRSFQFFLLILF